MSMDQVVPNLWIGDLAAALDADLLRSNNIGSILTVMRGKVNIPPNFIKYQVPLDDTEDADALSVFPMCIAWIDKELEKEKGILIHCQVSHTSRSATIAAAYIMCTDRIDVSAALAIICAARPVCRPNDGFMSQLEVFQKASYRLSRRDKSTRRFYLERAIKEVLNGDGSEMPLDMFAKYPRTPSDSAPATPGGPRRKIRCRMCRQELATREHMLDHNQGPATPASQSSLSPAPSRRPSVAEQLMGRPSSTLPLSERSISSDAGSAESSSPDSVQISQRSLSSPLTADSSGLPRRPSIGIMSEPPRRRKSLLGEVARSFQFSEPDGLPSSALETDEEHESDDTQQTTTAAAGTTSPPKRASLDISGTSKPSPLSSPSELLTLLNLKTTGVRSNSNSSLSMTPLSKAGLNSPISPPILVNPGCSGYFVEPMKWMEPILAGGAMAGKIICPNKKCGAKLGNFDWAGVMCSCKEWVTPGFCIARSKVDEIV
ncbi:hypothetical protein SISNIDRAFT_410716 [Sistotremastrum niveocremeum HHB9708]|uniref:protein-tyrosine-phosphatase n=1 Tax=Sistotremastrum niveocremeum HHB9708 TaxID=1314777 RepID=A0A164V8E4_9AGAM|nr:hypothetical protein SISNIDRAFT_410716 [Sistotremastrum niveocremeum HHB9708]